MSNNTSKNWFQCVVVSQGDGICVLRVASLEGLRRHLSMPYLVSPLSKNATHDVMIIVHARKDYAGKSLSVHKQARAPTN